MLTAALKALEPIEFKADRYEAAFDLGVRKYRSPSARDGLDFQVGLAGPGFEASRNLSRDDLVALRDWIDQALTASAPADTAEAA